jgi:hypothetical protein
MPDNRARDLRRQELIVLILFTIFAVVPNHRYQEWIPQAWPRHIVWGIYCYLDLGYPPIIQRPVDQIWLGL